MSGPGYWPLKPSIVTVRPNSTRRTGAATSVSVSPSASAHELARPRERDRRVVGRAEYDETSGRKRHQRRRHRHLRMHRRRRPARRAAHSQTRGARASAVAARLSCRASPASRNARSCGCMRTLADVPRRTRRPARSVGVARRFRRDQDQEPVEGHAAERDRRRSAPRRVCTTGLSCGVVAHATYAVYGPSDEGSGRSRRLNATSYCWSPAGVTAIPNGDDGGRSRAVPDPRSMSPAGSSSMQYRSGSAPRERAAPSAVHVSGVAWPELTARAMAPTRRARLITAGSFYDMGRTVN